MKFSICLLLLLSIYQFAHAQRRNIPLNQIDSRFTIRAESSNINFVNDEYYFFYIKNNTNDTYSFVVDVKILSPCFEDRNYKLGIMRVVHLAPGQEFTPSNDYFHLFSGNKEMANCRIRVGDEFTYISQITYSYSDIRNRTREEAEEITRLEKERLEKEAQMRKAEEEARLEKERLEKEAQVRKVEEEARLEKERLEKEAQVKIIEAESKRDIERLEEETQTQKPEEFQRSQDEARAAARRTEEARKKVEEEARQERQAEYDAWKKEAQEQRQAQELASATASVSFLFLMGGIIYDNMSYVNPNNIYKNFEEGVKIYAGLELGYSGTATPIIFGSEYSTMINGNYIDQNELIQSNIYTVNLELKLKFGLEHDYVGAYVYLDPKLGFSPLFEAGHLSLFNYGVNITGGIKQIKLYGDYSSGPRHFSNYSHDPEEYGQGSTDYNYSRIKYGIRFSLPADRSYSRGHLTFGGIHETVKVSDNNAYFHPEKKTLIFGSRSEVINGYFMEYKKDHMFNFFINVFPKYVYSGKINPGSGRLGSEFTEVSSRYFLEIGFLRAFDLWD